MASNYPDQNFSLNSTGTVSIRGNVAPGVNGTDTTIGYLIQPVAGQLLATAGSGEFSVNHVGRRGTLTAEVTLGAAGTARGLIALTSALTAPDFLAQIQIDASNRPLATIAFGGTTTVSTASGAALATGAKIQLKLRWDSALGVVEFRYFNGTAPTGTVGTLPAVPWTMSPMGIVLAGYGVSLAAFNGSIQALQVGDLY